MHGMSESGDKSGEFSMSERSEERGRDDGCGERCRCRSLGQEVRDERLVCLQRERRRWLVEVSEEDSVLPRGDGGHRWGEGSHVCQDRDRTGNRVLKPKNTS
jgi:hypothetical protein